METRRTARATMKRERSTIDSTSLDGDPVDTLSPKSTEVDSKSADDMAFSLNTASLDTMAAMAGPAREAPASGEQAQSLPLVAESPSLAPDARLHAPCESPVSLEPAAQATPTPGSGVSSGYELDKDFFARAFQRHHSPLPLGDVPDEHRGVASAAQPFSANVPPLVACTTMVAVSPGPPPTPLSRTSSGASGEAYWLRLAEQSKKQREASTLDEDDAAVARMVAAEIMAASDARNRSLRLKGLIRSSPRKPKPERVQKLGPRPSSLMSLQLHREYADFPVQQKASQRLGRVQLAHQAYVMALEHTPPCDVSLPVVYPLALVSTPSAQAQPFNFTVAADLELEQFATLLASVTESTRPFPYGKMEKGAALVTAKMRDQIKRRRAAHSLVRLLPLYSHFKVLGRSSEHVIQRFRRDAFGYTLEFLDRIVIYLMRWSISSITGAASNLARLRYFAEANGDYDAADADVYPAELVDRWLVHVRSQAVEKGERCAAKAIAEGRELTIQQSRRDGSGAENAAFRSIKWLLDNCKVETSADQPLVCNRKLQKTQAIPSPALEPHHYAQLCLLARTHESRVVRGTAAGLAFVASQTSRFKQAQSCSIVAEKDGVIYTAVVLDKSNAPSKRVARPAFGPLLDAFGTRAVIDAVYDMLEDVPEGQFIVRDNDSPDGAPIGDCCFVNGPLLDHRANNALQHLLSLPPLSLLPAEVSNFKTHSLKPFMLKHAARMRIDPVRRHGIGRFSGSAAQDPALIPGDDLLKQHRLRCAVLPDRYAQASALAVDIKEMLHVHADIRQRVSSADIADLASLEWDGLEVIDSDDDDRTQIE